MVRRAQMQKQMGGISSTKADKLLKKAKKMNNRMFNEGGVKMAEKKSKKPKTKKNLPFGMDEVFDIKKEFKKIPKKMAKGGVGEDPFKGDKPTGKKDKKGRQQYKRPDGSTYFRLPGGDDEKIKRNMGGTAQMKAIPEGNKGLPKLPKEVRNKMGYMKDGGTARSNNAKKSRGAGAMIKGTTFRGVF